MRICPSRSSAAFTIVELMVVVAVLALLIGILVPVLGAARRSSKATTCRNNLHQLVLAFDLFTQSHHGRFPPDFDQEPWDDHLAPYLSDADEVFACPADAEYDRRGVSYGWRNLAAVGDPALSLGGRQKGLIRASTLILVFELNGSWHEPDKINAATLDAAVSAYDIGEFEENMSLPVE